PEIDPAAAKIVRIVKGADAIEYGSHAMGGAIIIEAGSILHDPHLHGSAGYGFETNGRGNSLFTTLTQSFHTLDTRVTFSLKRKGDTHTPDYFLTNTGVAEANGSIQLNWKPSVKSHHQVLYSLFQSRLGIFTGSHIGN